MLEKLFGFDPSKHSVRTEILAGLTTFLTMAYILAVNPNILSAAGMDKGVAKYNNNIEIFATPSSILIPN